MRVAWVTSNLTTHDYVPIVAWGLTPDSLVNSATGTSDEYVAWAIISPRLHFAMITGLAPGNGRYYYRVGSAVYGWGAVTAFRSAPINGPAAFPLDFAVTGDMGVEFSNNTMNALGELVTTADAAGAQTITIHAGDLAYADNRQALNNGSWADGFLNDFYSMVSTAYAARVPLAFVIGNHEMQLGDIPSCNANGTMCRGLAYTKRVGPTIANAAASRSVYWNSFNVGPVHVISLSAEQAWKEGTPQFAWAAADIRSVDRTATPWVLLIIHRPYYCSNASPFCGAQAIAQRLAYEPLLMGNSSSGGGPAVDVVITAHVHCYERMWQVSGNGTFVDTHYDGMRTPLHIMQGSAGCIEGSTPWETVTPPWSAFRACEDKAFGFSTLHFANATHMRASFVNAATKLPIDEVWIRKL